MLMDPGVAYLRLFPVKTKVALVLELLGCVNVGYHSCRIATFRETRLFILVLYYG